MAARQMQMEQSNIKQPDTVTIIKEMMDIIHRETDKEKVLQAILPYALAVSQMEIGIFLAVDDEAQRMNAVAKQEMPDELIHQLAQGDLANLLLTGQRLWAPPEPSLQNGTQTLLQQHKLKCLFGLPLCSEGQVMGAIVVGDHIASERVFGQEQQRWLAMLAQLVALFLYNIRLRENAPHLEDNSSQAQEESPPRADSNDLVSDEMEQLLAAIMSSEAEVAGQNVDLGLLNALSHKVSGTLQSYAILEAAVEQTQKALGVEASWGYLFEDGVLNLHGHQGLSDQYVAGMQHLTPGDGVEGMAFSYKEPFLRDGVLFHSGQARTLVQEEGLRTVAAVPLQVEEKTLGVLAVANRHDWVWSARDKRMLTSISQQVARAIGNSQKFIEVQEKAQHWETNYSALQNTNVHLTERTQALEQHVQELQHIEQQIWVALAASQKSRRRSPGQKDPYNDEQLVAILKKALTTMDAKEYQLNQG